MEDIVRRASENIRSLVSRLNVKLEDARVSIGGGNVLLLPAASAVRNIENVAMLLGDKAARKVTYLYGKSAAEETARILFEVLKIEDPLERIIHGPLIFSASGIGSADLLTFKFDGTYFESLWECPNSVFVEEYMRGKFKMLKPPLCDFLAGYSAGWIQSATGIKLDTIEVWCRAQGKENCRFLVAPPAMLYKLKSLPENLKPSSEYQTVRVRFQ